MARTIRAKVKIYKILAKKSEVIDCLNHIICKFYNHGITNTKKNYNYNHNYF